MGFFACDYLEIIGTIFPEYRCKYSRQTLMPHTAQDICMSSRYTNCADFKNASRCFITTAVCLTLGKPDYCEELSVMRMFRDNWLRYQSDGLLLIEDYYKTAPEIVMAIDCTENRQEVYRRIYKEYILPCVENVKNKNFQNAKTIYLEMVNTLKELYDSKC